MSTTPSGKARSSRNALQHGLRATDEMFLSCLTRLERRAFERFRTEIHEEKKPETFEERLLVDRLAVQYLRQFRLYRIEHVCGGLAYKRPLSNAGFVPNLDRFSRYDWRINREIRRLEEELEKLVTKRLGPAPMILPPLN